MRRRTAVIVGVVLLLLADGAVGAGKRESGVPDDPLGVSSAIERFVATRVRSSPDTEETVRSLLDSIIGPRGLALDYADDRTRTAIETFESRNGNCLSFTLLFVVMARELGLDARFVEVMEVMSWSRRGNVVWSSRHMIAEVSTSGGPVQIDFLPEPQKRYRSTRRISDERTFAHFYNNLGAEALAAGDGERALELFSIALSFDERFTPALVNRGVAYRLLGDVELAEESYKAALEIDSAEMTAASNLSQLLERTGRGAEAASYARLVRKYRRRNPFYHFSLGLVAARAERHERAVTHFRRAIRRQRRDAGFREELAESLLELGRWRKARRSFERAVKHAEDDTQRLRLEARLRDLANP